MTAPNNRKRASRCQRIILDPNDPMTSARKLAKIFFTTAEGIRTIHFYRGNFYWYANGYYRAAEEGEARRAVWDFLDDAVKMDDGMEVPFQPNLAAVSNVTGALEAVCELGGLELPAWLPNSEMQGSDLPPHEFLVVSNGLLHVPTGRRYSHTPAFCSLNAAEMAFDP